MRLNCIVVDDDMLSRQVISHFVKKTNFLTLSEDFENAIDASQYINEEHVDIILLDIQMPEMTGMDFIKTLEKDYQIILITSEQKYAVEAFEKSVTDYLVKPVEYSRFLRAVQKAKGNIDLNREKTEKRKELYVRSESRLVRIPFNDILYVEALSDYVIIQTDSRKHIVHFTMKGIENRLPENVFVRTHRSFIVNLDKIESLEDNSIVIQQKYIPIGASYKDALMGRLNFL